MNTRVEVTKEFQFDCAHMLAQHKGLCRNLHGHTYKMEVTVTRERLVTAGPEEGMVMDFQVLKDIVKKLIVDVMDHATVIYSYSNDEFENQLEHLLIQHDKKMVQLPYRPTAENMAKDFIHRLNDCVELQLLHIQVTKIKLYETPTSYAIAEGI